MSLVAMGSIVKKARGFNFIVTFIDRVYLKIELAHKKIISESYKGRGLGIQDILL